MATQGTPTVAQYYFDEWTSPVLVFTIFGRFGVTSEARASYWRAICIVCGRFGWKPTLRRGRARSPLGNIEFGEQPPQDTSLGLESQPSYINHGARVQEQDAGSGRGHAVASEMASVSDREIVEEVRRVSDDIAHAKHSTQTRECNRAEALGEASSSTVT
ncbi:hypothetical protein PENSPDRAFT_190889 [Peniophora sp. CONT]|nr:hypothetical protein PENSPDRAFT_190889 [Peniophora sp. CONT]